MLWNACNGTSLSTTNYALVFKSTLCNWLTPEAVDTGKDPHRQVLVTDWGSRNNREHLRHKQRQGKMHARRCSHMDTNESQTKTEYCKKKKCWKNNKGKADMRRDNRHSVVHICSPVLDFLWKCTGQSQNDYCCLQQDGISSAKFSNLSPKPPCSCANAGDKPVLVELDLSSEQQRPAGPCRWL